VSELAHVYAELSRLGAGLRYLDVGGGLAVDYDGTATSSPSSMNYTIEEYAADVVYRVGAVCDAKGIDHPIILSESGRAIAAYSSVLVVEVVGAASLDQFRVPEEFGDRQALSQPVKDLLDAYEEVSPARLLECYPDAVEAHVSAMQMFSVGYLDLPERALAERLFWATCARIRERAVGLERVPEEIADLPGMLCDTYFCNFSVFQSLPDAWAIDQIFPVVPLQRLDEPPTREAVLADITCDSDGQLSRFVAGDGYRGTLPVHALDDREPYYLGVFLVGAYQETLGDLHNLFGDTHVVHVGLPEDGGWWIEEVIEGDTAAELLGYMQFDPQRLYPQVARDCEHAVREGRMTLDEARALRRFYEMELRGYSYLEPRE
jgi:arginine decarboxylase